MYLSLEQILFLEFFSIQCVLRIFTDVIFDQVSSQIITYEHEGNWSKALEHYDLLIRKAPIGKIGGMSRDSEAVYAQANHVSSSREMKETGVWKLHKGLMRSLQQIGCSHLLDVYFQGLTNQKCYFQHDLDFTELQVCS